MEVKDPFAKENAKTPNNMTRQQKSLSELLLPRTSPYPTVVIV